jgi:hypothetical protein
LVCPDGKTYTGEWKDGKNHGRGRLEFPIEQYTREGEWKEGRMDGEQIVTFKNGEIRQQLWVNFELAVDEVIKQAD